MKPRLILEIREAIRRSREIRRHCQQSRERAEELVARADRLLTRHDASDRRFRIRLAQARDKTANNNPR
jgi:hypothetical protein